MRIAVVEDEKAHRELLLRYISLWRPETGESVICEAFDRAQGFLFRYGERRDFDLLFIDIQMPGMNGMELAREVREGNRDIVMVFVTGLDAYLEEGYEVEALHYLMKPLDPDKVRTCLEKAFGRRRRECFLTLHTQDEVLKISQERVNYIEARGRRCCVGRTGEKDALEVKEGFSELEGQLDGDEFVKCHRSFLCRVGNIHHIGRTDIFFDDGSSIPVSRRLYRQVNQRFIEYFRGRR